MYALYEKNVEDHTTRYKFKEKASLFGRISGYIPNFLTASLKGSESEPFPWHIDVANAFGLAGQSGHTLIINLKPNSAQPNLSLYEVIGVWGLSNNGWTPVMLHLRGLLVDADPSGLDENDFVPPPGIAERVNDFETLTFGI
jgi:hypothetical protein